MAYSEGQMCKHRCIYRPQLYAVNKRYFLKGSLTLNQQLPTHAYILQIYRNTDYYDAVSRGPLILPEKYLKGMGFYIINFRA